MTHLPTELLHNIFIKLDLRDRVECMLVCHSWYNTLDRRSMLHSVNLANRGYPEFKDMVERFPYRATQVEYLVLDVCFEPNFDKRELCNMFSNLREIQLRAYGSTPTRTHYLDKPFHFTHATSKMEKITDFGECELTRQLARSNMCGKLTSLEIDFENLCDPASNRLLRELNNMPILKRLKLNSFRFSLMDLETIHNNLSSVKSFELDNAVIVSGDFPRNVIPTSVINLDLLVIEVVDLQTHIQFYKYLAKKYPSVINPCLTDCEPECQDAEYASDLYNEGIFPFYQKVGPQTDTMSLCNYCNGLDAFEKFDGFGMKLKILSLDVSCGVEEEDEYEDVFFIEELAQSKQAKYIQRLSVRNLVLTPMERMLDLEALVGLYIASNYSYQDLSLYTRNTIDLNQLIAACPTTLIDLHVEGFELTFSKATSTLPCVETLYLEHIDLTPDLAKVIETSFPKLSTLKISSALMDDVNIRLPENNFKLIKIDTHYEEGRQNGFSIKTISDNKIQYYSQDHSINQVVAVSKEEFDDPLVLNVTCASVEKIELSITEIYN